MPPNQAPIPVQCPRCETRFNVSATLRGKTIACPKCRESFAAATVAPAGDKAPARCSSCGTHLRVPPELLGQFGDCPKCRRRVRFENAESAEKEFSVSKTDGSLLGKEVHLVQGEARRSTGSKLQREMNEAAKDSYGKALAKSIVYPFQQLGALVFFVIGVPLAVVVTQGATNPLLEAYGQEGHAMAAYVRPAVALLRLGVPLAMASFFCSFLLGVVRNSARGGTSAPVAQGAAHTANLAALCAWMAAYFGLALLAGYLGRGPGASFAFTGPCVLFLALGGVAAPMGLLRAATVSTAGGLHVPRVLSAVFAAPGAYFGAVAVIGAGCGLYALLLNLLWGWADRDAGTWAADAWTFLAFLCLPMPLVSLARAVGVFGDYQRRRLPFAMDVFADAKASGLPMLVAAAGVYFLFQPVWDSTVQYAVRSGWAAQCRRQAEEVARRLINSPEARNGRITGVTDRNALERIVGPGLMNWPLTEEQRGRVPRARDLDTEDGQYRAGDFYAIVRVPDMEDRLSNMIVLYERVSTYPEAREEEGSGRVNAVSVNGAVQVMRLSKARALAALVEKMAPDYNGRERSIQEYNNLLGRFW